MKFKILDIGLAVLIASAVGVIGWRIFSQEKGPEQAGRDGEAAVRVQQAGESTLLSVSQVLTKPARRAAFGHWAHMVLDPQVPVSASQIASFSKNAGFPIKPKTTPCNRGGTLVETGLPILSVGLKQKIESQKGGLLFSYGSRRCFETGSLVEVLYYGDEDAEHYVERLGRFEIKELIELDYAKIKPTVWSQLGIVAADFADLKNVATDAVLIRVERRGESNFKEAEIPKFHFRYSELTKENASIVSKGPYLILDIRSRAEAAKVPLPNAFPFEYGEGTPDDKLTKFSWSVKLSQLTDIKLNVAPIMEFVRDPSRGKSRVIVVGNGPGDARVYWILRELSIAGVVNAHWYNGDATALTLMLKK